MNLPFKLALFCFVRPPSAIWLRSKLLCCWVLDRLLFLSKLSASVRTNFPRSGIAVFCGPLFWAIDALTRTWGCTVGCDIGGWCLGAPGILWLPPNFEPPPLCVSPEYANYTMTYWLFAQLVMIKDIKTKNEF